MREHERAIRTWFNGPVGRVAENLTTRCAPKPAITLAEDGQEACRATDDSGPEQALTPLAKFLALEKRDLSQRTIGPLKIQ
jgi:hypothetical protein